MGKRRRTLLPALLVVLVLGLAWLLIPSSPADPVYDGEPVSYWLRHPKLVPANLGGPIQPIAFQQVFPDMDSNAVPYLAEALAARDGVLHRAYTNMLPRIPLGLRKLLPWPIAAFEVRRNATIALQKMGMAAKPAIPELITALKRDDDLTVRVVAVRALKTVGKGNQKVIDALILATKDQESGVREMATQSLGILGVKDTHETDALVEALNDMNARVRAQAAQSLGNIGSGDEQVLDALVEALKDTNQTVRFNAARALKQIDPEAAVKTGVK